jgi:hypothetical protein
MDVAAWFAIRWACRFLESILGGRPFGMSGVARLGRRAEGACLAINAD